MRFAAAPVYEVFPTRDKPLKPYVAAVRASRLDARGDPRVRSRGRRGGHHHLGGVAGRAGGGPPLGHARAARDADRRARLPDLLDRGRPSATALGRRFWSRVRPFVMTGEEQGRVELNGARERVGLPPLVVMHGGISRDLAIVATFPQLEYPRADPLAGMRVTGPLLWEQPFGDVELPPGNDPLVLVAPSTSQDPEHRLVQAALEGLAGERVRVLATHNRRAPPSPIAVPPNARLVDWVSYARRCRCATRWCATPATGPCAALVSGVPVVACRRRGRHGGERGPDQVGRSRRALPRRFGRRAECASRCAAAGGRVPAPRRRAARLGGRERRRSARRGRRGGTRTDPTNPRKMRAVERSA